MDTFQYKGVAEVKRVTHDYEVRVVLQTVLNKLTLLEKTPVIYEYNSTFPTRPKRSTIIATTGSACVVLYEGSG